MARTESAKLEQLFLAGLAALPFYFSYVVSMASVAAFHLMLILLGIGIVIRRPVRVPAPVLAVSGVIYLLFFPFDVFSLSRGLIAPSSHLLFFITIYQAIESEWRENSGQRLFVTFLVFVTASATSTHVTIVLYMILFLLLSYRELVRQTRQATWSVLGAVGEEPLPLARWKMATTLAVATTLIAVGMFPFLPRVRDPFVRGVPSLSAARSTGISDTINFDEGRMGTEDPEVVARVWIERDEQRFLPIRLRAAVYDTWVDGRWVSAKRHTYAVLPRGEIFRIGDPAGATGSIEIQQRRTSDRRLFLPSGTWAVAGLDQVYRSQFDGIPSSGEFRRGPLSFTAGVSDRTRPIGELASGFPGYPPSDEIREMAMAIVGNETDTVRASRAIERYLSSTFTYVPTAGVETGAMTVDEFLLKTRRGHCEYFAAGMVVLLESIGIPSRIVGGFYGGERNSLGGYWMIRARDAHAWVEVEADGRWVTFDPTPPDLRPGAGAGQNLLGLAAMAAESFSYFWDRWILTYGATDQVKLTEQAVEAVRGWVTSINRGFRPSRLLDFVPFAVALAGVILILWLGLMRRRRGIWQQTLDELRRLGIEVGASETEGEVLSRVKGSSEALVPMIEPIVKHHQLERYSGRPANPGSAVMARRALARLRAINAVS